MRFRGATQYQTIMWALRGVNDRVRYGGGRRKEASSRKWQKRRDCRKIERPVRRACIPAHSQRACPTARVTTGRGAEVHILITIFPRAEQLRTRASPSHAPLFAGESFRAFWHPAPFNRRVHAHNKQPVGI